MDSGDNQPGGTSSHTQNPSLISGSEVDCVGWGHGCASAQAGRPMPTRGFGGQQNKWDSADSPFQAPQETLRFLVAENACHGRMALKSCSHRLEDCPGETWGEGRLLRGQLLTTIPTPHRPHSAGRQHGRHSHIPRTVAVGTTDSSHPHCSAGDRPEAGQGVGRPQTSSPR